jgi:hypothetical protein
MGHTTWHPGFMQGRTLRFRYKKKKLLMLSAEIITIYTANYTDSPTERLVSCSSVLTWRELVHIEPLRQKGRRSRRCGLNTAWHTQSLKKSDKAGMALTTCELPRDWHAAPHWNDVTSNALAVCLNTPTFLTVGTGRITLKPALVPWM